jgi:hypothetical protein
MTEKLPSVTNRHLLTEVEGRAPRGNSPEVFIR